MSHIDNIEQQIDTLRLKYITELLSKECIKGTSNLIATICL